MDRVNGNNPVDIGGGRRGFQSQNAAAGVAGTEVTAKYLNDVQEEICMVIENAGLTLDPQNQQQLWEALQSIAAPGFANRSAWLPVLSLTTTAPPNGATLGDAYIIPAGATGTWAGNQQKLAEWNGSSWRIVATKDGHGVSLPDGRVFEKVGGAYVEKIALDVQSGKWSYGAAAGSANALTATLAPALVAYTAGLTLHIKIATTNTGAATINVNGLGAKAIVDRVGSALSSGDLIAGEVVRLTYDGTQFRTIARSEGSNQVIASSGWVKLPGGLIMQWGGFTGTTRTDYTLNGVYESSSISVTWPIVFPNALLQLVAGCGTDVSGFGKQEQAWFTTNSKTGGTALVAAREASVSLSGSYIVFGY